MKKYVIAVYVDNKFGVLTRVTSMFTRRGFNIDALTVGKTESPEYSRITITMYCDEAAKEQVIRQLEKLVNVKKVQLMEKGGSVSRELMLIKVKNTPETKNDIMTAVNIFRSKIIDYSTAALCIEVTGDTEKLDAFIEIHLDAIEHDPWQLTSFLTTLYDDYTRSEVQAKLKETFAKQYKLTTWVEVQTRYRTVVMIDIFTGIPYTVQVPYEYRIFHTKLVNKGLEVVIREELNNDQWKRYEIFQDTLGGRPYLFNGGLPPGGSDGSGTPGIDYQVPAEALTDEEFAAIYKEAQKYVGTPYVWGGSTPETGFDCSGYVCWVYNQNGYDVGRTTANGLWQKSQHISEAEAKPGDLVFFEGTYDTPGKSHVGIYLGNGMMVSAGDPIKYADIHSSYWQKYLSGFGRLSK